jgi:hypothetical protein
VLDAARALGLEQGPVHAELRLTTDGPVVLEIAGRSIGGLCSRVLRFGLGDMALEEVILRTQLDARFEPPARVDEAAGVMMVPIPRAGMLREVHGIEAACRVEGVEDIEITVRRGERLVPLPEGASYLGFIFARGRQPAAAEQALRQAHALLEFDISPVLPASMDGGGD